MSKKMTMEEFSKYANNTVNAVADANDISNENMKKIIKAVDVEESRGVLDIKSYSSASSYLKKSENERVCEKAVFNNPSLQSLKNSEEVCNTLVELKNNGMKNM